MYKICREWILNNNGMKAINQGKYMYIILLYIVDIKFAWNDYMFHAVLYHINPLTKQ